MTRLLMSALLIVPLIGCAAAQRVEDKALDLLDKGATEYCKASPEGRQIIREKVNERLAPKSLKLDCGEG